MRGLLSRLREGLTASGTESRIRRGILLVVVAVVALTAVPVLLLSLSEGERIETRRVDLVAEFVARNLVYEMNGLRADIASLAGAPVVATALTDTSGREAYLRPFLQQRAEALRVGIVLRDYRGRPLLRLAEPEVPVAEEGPPRRPLPEIEQIVTPQGYVVIAPISLFLDNRLIGALEAWAPWSKLLSTAARELDSEVQLALFRNDALLDATPGPIEPWRLPYRMEVPGLPAGSGLHLAYGVLPGRYAGYFSRIAAVIVVVNVLALLLAVLAARKMARALTTPLARLVEASRRFSLGEMPELANVATVREIVELGEALANAFAAREQAQREMRLYTERLLEGLPVVVFSGRLWADGHLHLDYLSPGVTRVFGWAPEQMRTRDDFAARMSSDDRIRVHNFLCRLHLAGTTSDALEFAIQRADGKPAWVSVLARVIEREGAAAHVVGTLMDVTSERSLRAQAINAAKLSTLGEMATGLAHELNQPVTVMSLAAENTKLMLERQGAARIPEAIDRMDRITRQATRVRAIIDHLRVFARGDEGELEPVALRAAVEGAGILVGNALRQAGVGLTVDLPPDLPDVMARLVPAEQALVNLLLNARDAMQEAGTSAPMIQVVAEVVGDEVVLCVQDNGPGFPPDAMDRIFEPFFTTKEVGKGTGLGLSICHGIMRSFGGGIAGGVSPMGGAEVRLTFRRAHSWATAPLADAQAQPGGSDG